MKKIDVCVGMDRARNLAVRLSLMIVDDDNPDVVLSERFHRMDIGPGYPLAQARSELEAHIGQPYAVNGIPGAPWPKIPDEEWAEVEQIAAILHTPERIAKRIEADRKAMAELAPITREVKDTK